MGLVTLLGKQKEHRILSASAWYKHAIGKDKYENLTY